ncbi:flagellar hook-associated protein 3 FlgL [Halobacillus karajensis]|uniref:Hook-filament junction protein n=1 Tax=Halobacillus karajensis TaxID=195088 RepID=A0A059NY22_9BACI|nr:flagellar hook-associated protein FlgL [Halobacillus karajensis]CDQ19209.1 Hook-filament junction protein [Halobacillus karajensis]CDQ22717.1 Hook-filament junction protein [Halobacillus karajensis]CDQ26199.1 Hook-filament junction protein [Halobacillus karajensis]SEH40024.1 flagellar hook-associated protein 3 FlgL [Halobacillus karajensis]
MRVTQSMLSNHMLRNLSNSYAEMGKYQDQLSTGKKITRPSQDPVVAMKGINYRQQVTEVEQFQRNIGEVHNWMDNSDAALDKATQAMQRVRELTVQASNDTYDEGQRENVAKEIRQLKEHIGTIANTKVNDKHLFNGGDTTNPPFEDILALEETDLGPATEADEVRIEVSSGVKLQANVLPGRVFNQDLFKDLEAFAQALEGDASKGKLGDYLGKFDDHIGNIVNERADLGARMNRVELIEDRLETQKVSATKMMSDNEDADIEKVITNLKTQESVHRAAMGVGARIIQPTLMDFLR